MVPRLLHIFVNCYGFSWKLSFFFILSGLLEGPQPRPRQEAGLEVLPGPITNSTTINSSSPVGPGALVGPEALGGLQVHVSPSPAIVGLLARLSKRGGGG